MSPLLNQAARARAAGAAMLAATLLATACGSSGSPARALASTTTSPARALTSTTTSPARALAANTTSPARALAATTTSPARPRSPHQAPARHTGRGVPAPRIAWDPIPFGPRRKAEMAAYARRHYGIDTYRLIRPQIIVIHYTDTPDYRSTFNTFAPDVTDAELHELPGTCAHFVVDRAGIIHQLVPVSIMCRHTVGLNWTAIGIEHVGYSDGQVLGNRRQLGASLELVRWLRCRFGITVAHVIGHNESLSSPFHHENIASLRTQTHSDFNHTDMRPYRRRLANLGPCPRA